MPPTLETWLAEGEVADADWGSHVTRLANRGELGAAGRGLLIDLPALSQPFACVPTACAPGLRTAGRRSCCADLEVQVTEAEREAIAAALPEVAAWMAPRDARWAAGPTEPFEEGSLRRPGKRCVFAVADGRGLSCGLHAIEDATGRPRGALKPMPCRLFPLVVVDLGDGQVLLTAVSRKLGDRFGLPPARLFPCLRGETSTRSPVVAEVADTIRELWGEARLKRVRREVNAWRRAGN
jgi:hypothetical protein